MPHYRRFPGLLRTDPLVPASLMPPADFPLESLDLGPPVREAFEYLGVATGPDLAGVTVRAFVDCPGVGPHKVMVLRDQLAAAAAAGWKADARATAGPRAAA